MISENTALNEPVTEEDILDHEDYMDSLLHSQKQLADRLAHQAGEPHPLTQEMRYIQKLIEYAAKRLAHLRASGCFPSQQG